MELLSNSRPAMEYLNRIKEIEQKNVQLTEKLHHESFSFKYEIKTLQQLIAIKDRSTEKTMRTVETNIEETKSAIDEFRTGVEEIVLAINQITTATAELTKSSEIQGQASLALLKVIEMVQFNNESQSEALEKLNKHIAALKENSSTISDLLENIADIAETLHLLSINGAIEAARSGEHGRGFAVVSGETGSLSEKVKMSVKTQTATIKKILSFIIFAVNEEQVVHELTTNTETSIASAKIEIGKFVSEIEQIASATEQLSATIFEFRASIEEISATINNIGKNIDSFYTKFKSDIQLNKRISRITTGFNTISGQTNSLSDSADQQMRFIRNEFLINHIDSTSQIALARVFLTMPFHSLPDEYREEIIKNHDCESGSMFLCLMGTAGENPEWNDVEKSANHKYIQLPKRKEDLKVMPMLDAVFSGLGVDYEEILHPETEKERPAAEGYFLAEDAVNSPYIPAKDFISEYNVISQLSIGGVLPSGKIFTCFLFFKYEITEEIAENLNVIATVLQKTMKSFDEKGTYWRS